MPLTRDGHLGAQELPRDRFGTGAKNSLGSTLTLFEVPRVVAAEILAVIRGQPALITEDEAEEVMSDPLADINSQAVERIKDRFNELH